MLSCLTSSRDVVQPSGVEEDEEAERADEEETVITTDQRERERVRDIQSVHVEAIAHVSFVSSFRTFIYFMLGQMNACAWRGLGIL